MESWKYSMVKELKGLLERYHYHRLDVTQYQAISDAMDILKGD